MIDRREDRLRLAANEPVVVVVEDSVDASVAAGSTRRVGRNGLISFAAASYRAGVWLAGEDVTVVCDGGSCICITGVCSSPRMLAAIRSTRSCRLFGASNDRHRCSGGRGGGAVGDPQGRLVRSCQLRRHQLLVGMKYRCRQVQVAVVGEVVEIAVGEELIGTHPIRHDRTRKHGALAKMRRPAPPHQRRRLTLTKVSPTYRCRSVARVPDLETIGRALCAGATRRHRIDDANMSAPGRTSRSARSARAFGTRRSGQERYATRRSVALAPRCDAASHQASCVRGPEREVISRRVLPAAEPPTGQIAFVVADLVTAIQSWIDVGVGPWNVWLFDERMLRLMTYRGAPARFAARIALCSVGPLTYELVEPLVGPSIWEDFLDDEAARTHHLGYYVDDIDDAIAAMADRGFPVVQTGSGFGVDGDGAFAYFDTVETFGCYFEAIVGPRALPDPDAQFPLP